MKFSLLFIILLSVDVNAQLITFEISYSGDLFGNTATANGLITFDENLIVSSDDFHLALPITPDVELLELTVSGATSGNGTFSLSDFNLWTLYRNGAAFDLSQDLVGQSTLEESWGSPFFSGASGDFNLFSATVNAPTGTQEFQLTTNGGNGDKMILTLFIATTAVPLPPSIVLLFSGLLGIITISKRCKSYK